MTRLYLYLRERFLQRMHAAALARGDTSAAAYWARCLHQEWET